jgi:hypothetical protein
MTPPLPLGDTFVSAGCRSEVGEHPRHLRCCRVTVSPYIAIVDIASCAERLCASQEFSMAAEIVNWS